MQINEGSIMISSPLMDDAYFKETVLFIAEHNENGTLAFVINKISDRPLNALIEFNSSPALPLHNGGPVDIEHLFFIHRRSDLIDGGKKITNDVFFGGDFKQAIKYINDKTLTEAEIKIFIGYCGWDNNELETEIAEGSWLFTDKGFDVVFNNSNTLNIVK